MPVALPGPPNNLGVGQSNFALKNSHTPEEIFLRSDRQVGLLLQLGISLSNLIPRTVLGSPENSLHQNKFLHAGDSQTWVHCWAFPREV